MKHLASLQGQKHLLLVTYTKQKLKVLFSLTPLRSWKQSQGVC